MTAIDTDIPYKDWQYEHTSVEEVNQARGMEPQAPDPYAVTADTVLSDVSPWQLRKSVVLADTQTRLQSGDARDQYLTARMTELARARSMQYDDSTREYLNSADPKLRDAAENMARNRLIQSLPPDRVSALEAQFLGEFKSGGAATEAMSSFLEQRHTMAGQLVATYKAKHPNWTPDQVNTAVLAELQHRGYEPTPEEAKGLNLPPLPQDAKTPYTPVVSEIANFGSGLFGETYKTLTSGLELGTAIGEAYDTPAKKRNIDQAIEGPHTGAPISSDANRYAKQREYLSALERRVLESPLLAADPVPYLGGTDIAGLAGQMAPTFYLMAAGATAARGATLAGKTAEAFVAKASVAGVLFAQGGASAYKSFLQQAQEAGMDPADAAKTVLGGALVYGAASTALMLKGPFQYLETKMPGVNRRIIAMAMLGGAGTATSAAMSITRSALEYGLDLRSLNWDNVFKDIRNAAAEGLAGGLIGAATGGVTWRAPGAQMVGEPGLSASGAGPSEGPGGRPGPGEAPGGPRAPGGAERPTGAPGGRPRPSTLYDVLGVGPDATAEEIRSAYQRAAKQWHPDVNKTPEAAQNFQRATEAYQRLRDPVSRKAYDPSWRPAPAQETPKPRPSAEPAAPGEPTPPPAETEAPPADVRTNVDQAMETHLARPTQSGGRPISVSPTGEVEISTPQEAVAAAESIIKSTEAMHRAPGVQPLDQSPAAQEAAALAARDRMTGTPATELVAPPSEGPGAPPRTTIPAPGSQRATPVKPIPPEVRMLPEASDLVAAEKVRSAVLPEFSAMTPEQELAHWRKRSQYWEDQANTDKLTGLGNRFKHDNTLAEFKNWADANNQPISILQFDVAAFKAINDLQGHDAGDTMLKAISESIRGVTAGREGDIIVTRQGGDEFAVFMRGADEGAAKAIVQRIEGAVGQKEVVPGLHTFIAGGITTYRPGDNMAMRLAEGDAQAQTRKQEIKAEIGDPLTRAGAEAAIAEAQAKMVAKADPTPEEISLWDQQARPGETPRETEQRIQDAQMLANTRKLGPGQEGTFPTSLMTTAHMSPIARAAAKAVGPIARSVPGSAITPASRTYEEGTKNLDRPSKNVWVRQDRSRSNGERVLMVQFSSDLLQVGTRDAASAYFDAIYDGPYKNLRPDDFWEIPTWPAVASAGLSNVDFYVVRNMAEAIKFLNEAKYGRIAMSVLDSNARFARQIADGYKGLIDVGGPANLGKTFEGIIATPAAPAEPTTFGSLGGALVSADGKFSLPENAVMYAPDEGTPAGGFVTKMGDGAFTATAYLEPKAKAVEGVQTQPRVERELGFFPSKEAAQAAIDSVNKKTPPAEPTGHVTPWTDIAAWIKDLGGTPSQATDYRLFAGTPTIGRLSFSKGCTFKCSFCGVDKDLVEYSQADVDRQVDSLAALDSPLVYLNDKTWGQAANHTRLVEVYNRMKARNPNFRGFIIQTAASQMQRISVQYIQDAGIKFIELGVESYNDGIVAAANKKHSSKRFVDAAVEKIRESGASFIPNILIGMPGETAETYANTFGFIRANQDIIPHLNIYNLVVFENTGLADVLKAQTEGDVDQNQVVRSWHTPEERTLHLKAAEELFALATKIAKMPPVGMRDVQTQAMLAKIEEIDNTPAPEGNEGVISIGDIPPNSPQAGFISGLLDFLKGEEAGSLQWENFAAAVGTGVHGVTHEVVGLMDNLHTIILDESHPLTKTGAGLRAISLIDEATARQRLMAAPLIQTFDAASHALTVSVRRNLRKWARTIRPDGQTNYATAIEHPERIEQWPPGAREMVAANQNMLDVTGQAAVDAVLPQLRAVHMPDGSVEWKILPFEPAAEGRYLRNYTKDGMDLMAFQDKHELWPALVKWLQDHPDRNPYIDPTDPEKLRVQLEGARQSGKTKKAGSLEFTRIFRELPVALQHPKTGDWVEIQVRDPRTHFMASVMAQTRRLGLWTAARDELLPRYPMGSFRLQANNDIMDMDGLIDKLRAEVVGASPEKAKSIETSFNRLLTNYQRQQSRGFMDEYLSTTLSGTVGQGLAAVDRIVTSSVLMLAPMWDAFNPMKGAAVVGWGHMMAGYASAIADIASNPRGFAAEYQAMGAVIDSYVEWTAHRDQWFSDAIVRNVPQAMMTLGRYSEVFSQFVTARMFDRWVLSLNNAGVSGKPLSADDVRLLRDQLRLTKNQVREIAGGQMSPATRAKVLQNGVNVIAGLPEAAHRKGAIQNHPLTKWMFRFLSVVNASMRFSLRLVTDLGRNVRSTIDPTLPPAARQKAGTDAMKAGWRLLTFAAAVAGAGFLQKYLRRAITGQPLVNVNDPQTYGGQVAGALAEGGIYGPFYRILETNNYSNGRIYEMPTRLVFPASVAAEVGSALLGLGKYQDTPWSRRLRDLGLQYTPAWRAIDNWHTKTVYPSRADYSGVRSKVVQYNRGRGIEPTAGFVGDVKKYSYSVVFEAIRDGNEDGLADALKYLADEGHKAKLDGKTVRDHLRMSLMSRRPINLSTDPKDNQRQKFLKTLSETDRAKAIAEERRYELIMNRITKPSTSKAADWYGPK
ncbi:MAG: diguanylate cyclase [Planctomycetia bacterium]|nr:diguanylate cyclase [Planctomycetia bacterium]